MGDPVPVSIGRGSNRARQGQGGLSAHVNAYTEDLGEMGKTPFTAFAINGWQLFAALPGVAGINAQLAIEDSLLLAVTGRQLYSISPGGAVTNVGGIASDGLVTMARNRLTPNPQVAIVVDGLWYIYQGGTLTQGTDPNLPPPLCVVESDGYFIFPVADGRWFLAGPNQALPINPLDFAEAEASADNNVTAAVRGRTLIFFGGRSTEFWDPNGDPVFPYARTTAINFGALAAGTVARAAVVRRGSLVDTIVFAATDQNGAYCGVAVLDGYSPTIISTGEVDRLIRDEPDKTSFRSMGWSEDGHLFYLLSGSTFSKCYDGKTNEWHDRKSEDSPRWNGICHAQFGSRCLFGHQSSPNIYESKASLLDEAGKAIIYQIQPPPIIMWPKGFKISRVWLDMITGVGLSADTDWNSNPVVVLDYSKDGGDSWAAARQLPLGAIAQRWVRLKSRAFGRFDGNGVTLRITCSAKVVKGLQQLAIDASPLRG